jgi:hypothetical protein
VDTYNEPFAGSLAVLLGRPHAPRVETVNDLDATSRTSGGRCKRDPEGVAYYADYPVNETDLHARHLWLVNQGRVRWRGEGRPGFLRREDRRLVGVGAVLVDRLGLVSAAGLDRARRRRGGEPRRS